MKHRAGQCWCVEGRARIYWASQESERGRAPLGKGARSPHENAGGLRMPIGMRRRRRSTRKLRKSMGQSLTHLHIPPGDGWFHRSSRISQVRVLGEQASEKSPSYTTFCLLYSGKMRKLLSSLFQTLESKLDIIISKRPNLYKALFLTSCMLYGMPIKLHGIRTSQNSDCKSCF